MLLGAFKIWGDKIDYVASLSTLSQDFKYLLQMQLPNDISHSGVSTSLSSLVPTDSSDDDTFKFEINIYLQNTDRQSITGIKLDNEN